jgi:general stress protein YciG
MEKGQDHEDAAKTGKAARKGQGAPRGFAAMDEAKQREIARKGGESVPAEKRSFSRNHELAAAAGRKGGESVPAEKRSFSRDHELAAEAGREGGKHSHGGGRTKTAQSRTRSEESGGKTQRSDNDEPSHTKGEAKAARH